MLAEVLAAALVGFALLWLVLQPMIGDHTPAPADTEFIDPEETERGQALLALKEIEFDRATGKLSDADYATLNARYSAVAIAALEAPEPSSAPRCLTHGPCDAASAKFCPVCGSGLVTAEGACVACGTTLPDAAEFCPGCGVPVRS